MKKKCLLLAAVALVLIALAAACSPTPTAKPAPTEAPAPTLTPESIEPELDVLSFTDYEDTVGWWHVVGEVRNNSSYPVQFVKIVITIYDDAGNVVGTDFTYTTLDVIAPGGKSPFRTGTEEYTGVSSYEVQVEAREGTLARQDLVIRGDSSYVDNVDWLHIQGEVANTGDTPAEWVTVMATLYDDQGHVVEVESSFTDPEVLPAGGSGAFEILTDQGQGFDHYELQVQGQ